MSPSRKPVRRQKQVSGWREWIALPSLGLPRLKAKLDTGARTSALHAVKLEVFHRHGQEWVRCVVHPKQRSTRSSVVVEARVIEWRDVTSSNGLKQRRPVIAADISFFGETWPIELTLSNRTDLGFRMLLGREALRDHLMVDASRSFLGGKPGIKKKRKKRTSEKP